jgi:hypothetical protein
VIILHVTYYDTDPSHAQFSPKSSQKPHKEIAFCKMPRSLLHQSVKTTEAKLVKAFN